MARCEATTQSGNRCKLEAGEGSRFCHLHEEAEDGANRGDHEPLEFDDFLPLILAGAATVAFVVVFKSLGKLIPRF
jgi:hypothetical protein